MAYYPMQAALHTPDVDKVYLSTDDPDLMRLARENGVEIIERPAYLCTQEALGEEAYVHGYQEVVQRNARETIELMVLLFCNAPTVSPKLITQGIAQLRKDPSLDSAVTVSCYNMWSPLRARREDEEGLLKPFVPFETFGDPKTLNCDRDSQGEVWFADMSVSIVRPRCLDDLDKGLLPQKWMGQRIFPVKQSGGLDVDYAWQVPQAEYWLKEHKDELTYA